MSEIMLQIGTVIADRYEIADTVGSGGMSVVYKALDHRLNRYVAVKILKEEFSNDRTFVTKFRVEAQSAAGLSHPNIVNVYDVGDDEGVHYIVMELIEGITLKEYIQKKGHLTVSEAVNFSLQIASGMEVAHENHIIHRDIKPQNIIVAPSGILKVTDFGIAKASTSATISSNAIGSVHYISPEQARGGFSDERSDIYSLGITMYEMVTGRVPFEGDNNVTVALMHIQNEMIPPTEYYPDILPSLEKVIAKCTQKKPERRYLTANALIADLRRVESDPNGNFVRTTTLLDDAPTKMMGDAEVKQIKDQSVVPPVSNVQSQEEPLQPAQPAATEPELEEDVLEEDKLDPKMERLAVILGVVAAVLVVMLILFFVGSALGIFGGSSKKSTNKTDEKEVATTQEIEDEEDDVATTEKEGNIEVPDVVDLPLATAKERIQNADLLYEIEMQESNTVEKDTVIRQSPEAGSSIAKGESVKLIVSSGKSTISIPDVKGYEDSQAVTLLEEDGFVVKHAYAYSDKVEKGKVIKQSPEGNAEKGTTVTITVSQGKETKEVTMVSLIGMSLSDAKAKLQELGFASKNISVTKASSDAYDKGEVIAQNYNKGDVVTTDTTIALTVSDGPDTSNVVYKGTVTIDDCLSDDIESAGVKLYLNDSTEPFYSGTLTHDSFPFSYTLEGKEAGTGTVTVYVDGIKQSGTYSVTFNAVEN